MMYLILIILLSLQTAQALPGLSEASSMRHSNGIFGIFALWYHFLFGCLIFTALPDAPLLGSKYNIPHSIGNKIKSGKIPSLKEITRIWRDLEYLGNRLNSSIFLNGSEEDGYPGTPVQINRLQKFSMLTDGTPAVLVERQPTMQAFRDHLKSREAQVKVELKNLKAKPATQIKFIPPSPGNKAVVIYEPKTKTLTTDLSKSAHNNFKRITAVRTQPLPPLTKTPAQVTTTFKDGKPIRTEVDEISRAGWRLVKRRFPTAGTDFFANRKKAGQIAALMSRLPPTTPSNKRDKVEIETRLKRLPPPSKFLNVAGHNRYAQLFSAKI